MCTQQQQQPQEQERPTGAQSQESRLLPISGLVVDVTAAVVCLLSVSTALLGQSLWLALPAALVPYCMWIRGLLLLSQRQSDAQLGKAPQAASASPEQAATLAPTKEDLEEVLGAQQERTLAAVRVLLEDATASIANSIDDSIQRGRGEPTKKDSSSVAFQDVSLTPVDPTKIAKEVQESVKEQILVLAEALKQVQEQQAKQVDANAAASTALMSTIAEASSRLQEELAKNSTDSAASLEILQSLVGKIEEAATRSDEEERSEAPERAEPQPEGSEHGAGEEVEPGHSAAEADSDVVKYGDNEEALSETPVIVAEVNNVDAPEAGGSVVSGLEEADYSAATATNAVDDILAPTVDTDQVDFKTARAQMLEPESPTVEVATENSGNLSPLTSETAPSVMSGETWEADVRSLLSKGKELLDEGRRLMNEEGDIATSESAFTTAVMELGKAAALLETRSDEEGAANSEEVDKDLKVEIFSVWGLALLQHGRLKVSFVERLAALEAASATGAEATGQAASELSLQAEELLVDSGRKFREALLLKPQSERALFNWGLALCFRARLMANSDAEPADAVQLYLASAEKFEALLEVNPKMDSAMRNLGLALWDASGITEDIREQREFAEDAAATFEELLQLVPDDQTAREVLQEIDRRT